MWLALILYALFASVFTISKTALSIASPLFLIGSRMLLASFILLVFSYFTSRSSSLSFVPKKVWVWLVLLGFTNIYLTNMLEFWGLGYLTSGKTCFLYSLSPFVSALLSYLLFSERLSSAKWQGLLIGSIGFVPILLVQTVEERASGTLFLFSWAELSIFLATVCSAYGWILLKQIVSSGLSPMQANGLSMGIGGVLALMHSWYSEPWQPFPVTDWVVFFKTTLALVIISNLICYNLYGYLLKQYSPTFLSFAGFTTPLFATLFGWFFLNEPIDPYFFVSYVLVLSGLTLFHRGENEVRSLEKDEALSPAS